MTRDKVKRQLAIAERQKESARLYAEGFSVAAIAQALGVSTRLVYLDLDAAMELWQADNREAVSRYIAEHMRRLEELYLSMLPGVANGSARCAEVAAKILERQARLIGMDQAIDHVETDSKIIVEYVDIGDPNPPLQASSGATEGTPRTETL